MCCNILNYIVTEATKLGLYCRLGRGIGCTAIQLLHCRQLGRLGRTDVGAGRWACRALGAQGSGHAGRAGAGRWVSGGKALGRVTRRRAAGGRKREARGRGTRGARHEQQARGRASGETAEGLLRHGHSCYDTTPVRAVRAAMHGLGVAWCAGWASWGLMQPVWFLTWVFDSGVFLSHRMDSVHEHCSSRNFSNIFFKYFKFN